MLKTLVIQIAIACTMAYGLAYAGIYGATRQECISSGYEDFAVSWRLQEACVRVYDDVTIHYHLGVHK